MSNLVKHIKIGDVVYDLCDPNAATQTALTTAEGKITTLNSSVTTLNTDVTKMKSDIEEINRLIDEYSNYNIVDPDDNNDSSDNG